MSDTQRRIEQALSLRQPQKESLDVFAKLLKNFELTKDVSIEETLEKMQETCPSLRDFERIFPCLCFALATGVGKTRLMGAMIAYIHKEYNVKNFMVLAPNLTIYNKLIKDFQDRADNPKYVFTGLADIVGDVNIITGDDYDKIGAMRTFWKNGININIFNISKIDSDKDARGTPRVRRMAEYLGQSYFDYLSGLKDLVLIMDEAHRYRANAGMAAINELHPVLGIELTATPKTAGAKGTSFKNIVYEYNLAKAIRDGFVKKPAVVGRSDFDKNLYGSGKSEELENLKIIDAIKVHESVKAELRVYAENGNNRLVKPFIMIVAETINHAEEIKARIDSNDFEDGRYKGKVLVVNSKQNGELKDDMLEQLLEIESPDNSMEIVIHVNMLGEGWDVNNLYTIVPLRAANSKILVEQSIGRGLRLPFGKLTGNDMMDRLHVIAHDKFADIIDAARNEDFEFQKEYISDEVNDLVGKVVEESKSSLDLLIEKGNVIVLKKASASEIKKQPELEVFEDEQKRKIGTIIQDVITDVSHYVETSEDLMNEDVQERIIKNTEEKINQEAFNTGSLILEQVDIKETVRNYTEKFKSLNIDTPRIKFHYEQEGDYTFEDFDIDVSDFNNYKPLPQKVLIKEILDKEREAEMQAEFIDRYEDITHYLLIDFDVQEIDYHKNSVLLNKLVRQIIDHITSYSGGEQETRKILFFHGKEIAKKLGEQVVKHMKEAPVRMHVKVDSGYSPITSKSYMMTATEGWEALDYKSSVKDKTKIRNMVFEGFSKCLFSKQKFDSCTEKDLCVILERSANVLKWFKISNDRAKEIFDIKYYNNQTHEYNYYLPDFIVETTDAKYMIETKAAKDIDTKSVQQKKEKAVLWCKYATEFELKHNGKPWYYLLVPDDTVVLDRSFEKLVMDCKEE